MAQIIAALRDGSWANLDAVNATMACLETASQDHPALFMELIMKLDNMNYPLPPPTTKTLNKLGLIQENGVIRQIVMQIIGSCIIFEEGKLKIVSPFLIV